MAVDRFHKPIGVVKYNYDTIRETLHRNIGNTDHEYDSFGSIIGGVETPYRTDSNDAWFFNDQWKGMYPDYLSYMKGIYSSKLNSDALTEKSFSFKLTDRVGVDLVTFYYDDNVGVVDRYDIVGSFNGMINTNPNYQWIDSKLGETNNYYLSHTLMKAAMLNNIEMKTATNITASLPTHFGLSPTSVDDITTRYLFDPKGRINTFVNFGVSSPIDINNWGNYGWIANSSYRPYYDSLSPLSKSFYMKSMHGVDLMSDTEVDVDVDNFANLPKIDYPYIKDKRLSRFYLNRLIGNNGIKKTDVNDWYIQFDGLGNETFENGYLFSYAEQSKSVGAKFREKSINNGTFIHGYNITPDAAVTDLVAFTNAHFKINEAYKTLHARFHTEHPEKTRYEASQFETAISNTYGMSMGRNLLRYDHATTHKDEIYNGYSNPYCRVWTYHYQYHRLIDTIRPFFQSYDGKSQLITQSELNKDYNWSTFRSNNRKRKSDGTFDENWIPDGGERLKKYGVTNDINGLVNITPAVEQNADGKLEVKVKPQQCMFSIENLAWKGMFLKNDPENGLSEGEIGPNGGRIMWFPPYNINFNENVNVNWSATSFIGRGENIYSYVNTERSGVLSFTILVDHPSILNYWERKYDDDKHTPGVSNDSIDDVDSKEQELLRFFAGCSILTATKPPKIERYIPPKQKPPQPKPNMEKQEVRTYDKELVFYVFYPNNYSGVDDAPKSTVSAMEYLLNGFGTQKHRLSGGTVEDLGTTINKLATYDGKTIGGYEMRRDIGCSLVTSNTASGNTNYTIGEITYPNLDDTIVAVTHYVPKTRKHWFYRVDKRVEHEILRTENYVDSDSFGLNSEEGYTDLLNIFTDQTEDNLYSFTDIFAALEGSNLGVESTLYDIDKVNELKSIFEKYKIKSVHGSGYASSHGYTSSNNILNKNRAQSVIDWLRQYTPFNSDGIDYSVDVTDIGNVGKIKSVSEFQPKVYRSAKIVVTYEVEETVTIQEGANETVVETRDGSFSYTQNRYLYNDGKNPLMSDTYQPYFNANNSLYKKSTLERKPIDLRQQQEYIGGLKSDLDQMIFNSMIKSLPSETENGTYVTEQDGSSVRYTDEEKFFMLLKDKDPFLHHKITEKIKYFDPAFHSITPEGFNARLTFLHQCTRQGSTIGGSDNMNVSTATNLAFGRPPVCVLRIGDQYNTKIIIDSMSIDFGDMTWDFNPEGIGVQQMLANVTLSFKFLGGSDLVGAISRLQNALSFNYYANTGVYDNRADMIEKQDDGTIRMKCFK